MQRIIGLVVVLAAVIGGFMIAGGNPAMLWQPAEFVVIFGAAIGVEWRTSRGGIPRREGT